MFKMRRQVILRNVHGTQRKRESRRRSIENKWTFLQSGGA